MTGVPFNEVLARIERLSVLGAIGHAEEAAVRELVAGLSVKKKGGGKGRFLDKAVADCFLNLVDVKSYHGWQYPHVMAIRGWRLLMVAHGAHLDCPEVVAALQDRFPAPAGSAVHLLDYEKIPVTRGNRQRFPLPRPYCGAPGRRVAMAQDDIKVTCPACAAHVVVLALEKRNEGKGDMGWVE